MSSIQGQVDGLFSGEDVEVSQVSKQSKVPKPGMVFPKLSGGKKVILTLVTLSAIIYAINDNINQKDALRAINFPHNGVESKNIDSFNEFKGMASPEILAQIEARKARIANGKNGSTHVSQDNVFHQRVINDGSNSGSETESPKKKDLEVNSSLINKISPTYLKDPESLGKIEKITDFQVPANLSNNQVASWIVKHTASRSDFKDNEAALLLATTMYRESFVNHLYNDVGYASIGPGQTVGVNSVKAVREKFSSVGVPKDTVDFLAGVSNKKLASVQLPSDYKRHTVTGQQGSQLALLHLYKESQTSIINSLGVIVFKALLPTQKNSLMNLAYQKGSIGQTTSQDVKNYVKYKNQNPNLSTEQLNEAFKKVTANYTMFYNIEKNGQKMRVSDERALFLARNIADNPDLVIKIFTNTLTPKQAKEYSAATKQSSINIASDGSVELNDPMKKYKEEAARGEVSLSVDKEIIQKAPRKTGGWTDISKFSPR